MLASCATAPATGPNAWSVRREAELERCNATGDVTSCQNAGDALIYEQEPAKAVMAYSRGCVAGSRYSCRRAIELGDKDSLLQSCKLGVFGDCATWIYAAPVDDPRWPSIVEYVRTNAPRTFDEVLEVVARNKGPVEPWARLACESEPVDVASCASAARLPLAPALRFELTRKACEIGSGVTCEMIAADLIVLDEPAQLQEGRAYLRKACVAGQASACEQETWLARLAQNRIDTVAACKRGDVDACARLGQELAERAKKNSAK
ncbi:MAG: hypothetical protein KBG15_14115 [Kofleriaceae bacterium]|nr:hypothetical protein [Kofleriaceae bacterium]